MEKRNIVTRALNLLGLERRSITVAPTNSLGLPYGFSSSPIAISSALQLSTVYRSVDVISDAIASQTWEYLEYRDKDGWESDPFNPIAYMLNNEPSISMSRYTLFKTLIAKVLLEGNGYLIINRKYDMGDPQSLTLVNGDVKIFMRNDQTLYYEVTPYLPDSTIGKAFNVDDQDMIHVLNYSYDGINGISTLRHAYNTLGLATASEATATGFFLSGANMAGILQTEGKLTKPKAQEIKDSWAAAFNITSGQPGGIAVMESGLTFIPVTINPKDAQMLETRQFNVIDICRFFGVHPSKVFDSANLTYSNIESFQLGFLTDTISPWDSKIEAEFNRKLLRPGKRIKTKLNLNLDDLLRANMDSTANYVSKMFQCGGYTVNEVRAKIGQPKVKGGDKAYAPMNLIPVDTPVTQNKGMDKNINVKVKSNGEGDTDNSE
jgi:HK97 family phage portal protein